MITGGDIGSVGQAASAQAMEQLLFGMHAARALLSRSILAVSACGWASGAVSGRSGGCERALLDHGAARVGVRLQLLRRGGARWRAVARRRLERLLGIVGTEQRQAYNHM